METLLKLETFAEVLCCSSRKNVEFRVINLKSFESLSGVKFMVLFLVEAEIISFEHVVCVCVGHVSVL